MQESYKCQKTKKIDKKYGNIPIIENKDQPWDTLCVDLIGPYRITQKGLYINGKQQSYLILWCTTMIDTVRGWFEMA